jgi:RNA-directed DNA polymerase
VGISMSGSPIGTSPPISGLTSREDVARFLRVSDRYLRFVLYGRRDREKYRQFKVPKKSGGHRDIFAPPRSLAFLQRKIAVALLAQHKPKPASHGFLRDRSIVTNAKCHAGQAAIFNLDLKDFFPSIHFGRLQRLLQKKPFRLGGEAATVICQICFEAAGRLPQGAPSSPIISNLVCRALDDGLQRLAHVHGCVYTRYADDLTFSTSRPILPAAIAVIDASTSRYSAGSELAGVITASSFTINPTKVRLYRRDRRQEVTGLTVNENPNVRRAFVRDLDAIIHGWRKYGYEAASAHYVKLRRRPVPLDRKFLINVLRGKLAFIRMVKGESDPLLRRLQWAFHDLCPESFAEPTSLSKIDPTALRGHVGSFRGWQWIARRYSCSIKFVQLLRGGEVESQASAFVVGANLLATAGHLINAHHAVRVGWDGSGIVPAKVCYVNEKWGRDLALLFFDGSPFVKDEPLRFQYRLPEIGEEVSALGFPRIPGRDNAIVMHTGTVEALPISHRGDRFIQTSFQSGGGLSGAPVIDRRGYVLGIMAENVFLRGDGAGMDAIPDRPYGQAVPFEYAARGRDLLLSNRIERFAECGYLASEKTPLTSDDK